MEKEKQTVGQTTTETTEKGSMSNEQVNEVSQLKLYLAIWWDGNNLIDVYELGENGIDALHEGEFEGYMNKRFGTCVGNHAFWYLSPDKPLLKKHRQKV